VIIKKKYQDRNVRNQHICQLCGRGIPKPKFMVQVAAIIDYDGTYTTFKLEAVKEWDEDWRESGDYGYVGSTCVKEIPSAYKKKEN
jgi:hypothetical protein